MTAYERFLVGMLFGAALAQWWVPWLRRRFGTDRLPIGWYDVMWDAGMLGIGVALQMWGFAGCAASYTIFTLWRWWNQRPPRQRKRLLARLGDKLRVFALSPIRLQPNVK